MSLTTPPPEIRFIREADVPQSVALVRDVLAEFGLCFGQGAETDEQLLGLPASYQALGGAFWVAARGAEVLGTCGVCPVAPGTVELRKMYLHAGARGLGLGRRLLEAAMGWAREQGATRMVLDTTERMTRAIAFYEANGFLRDDREIRGTRCSRGYARGL